MIQIKHTPVSGFGLILIKHMGILCFQQIEASGIIDGVPGNVIVVETSNAFVLQLQLLTRQNLAKRARQKHNLGNLIIC